MVQDAASPFVQAVGEPLRFQPRLCWALRALQEAANAMCCKYSAMWLCRCTEGCAANSSFYPLFTAV